MFAVARYASDEGEEYQNNFLISDRSRKRSWGFGFGYDKLGYTFLGGPVSTTDQESHQLTLNSAVTIGENFQIVINGTSCEYNATSTGTTETLEGILAEINSQVSSNYYSYISGSTIYIRNRTL